MIFTDDPLHDFDQYDMELAEDASSRPECWCCNSPIWDDHYFEICGRIFCPECIDDAKHYID